MIKFPTLITALIVAATVTAPAFAQEPALPTAQVETADLNLASPAGQKLLDRRIKFAARSVCSLDVSGRPVNSGVAFQRCVFKAVKGAQPAIDRQIALAVASRTRIAQR
jgi:UrcA family protein